MKLSIVTITRDNHSDLVETLESVKRLTSSKNVEQIVVDSSNTKVAKENRLACDKLGVSYYHQVPNGIAAAFNFGVKKANGEWIWFLNSGDKLLPDVDANNLQWLLEKSDADCLVFQIFMSRRGKSMPTPLKNLWPPMINWINHPGTITRKDALEEVGLFNERYKIAMDAELWFRFFDQCKTADLISVPLVSFRDGGISSDQKAAAREILKIYIKHTPLLLRSWFEFGWRIIKGWLIFIWSAR